jgi:predicted transposase YdaD
MLDPKKALEILENHFANLTQEEFLKNLKEYCPELFEEESNDLELERLKNTELYQQAKKESKLEIAPKLLKKGFSVQEVAEILELDVRLIA